ncbi:hypothetical protein EYF80_009927 [Liparis tanakae]|uniref:Uncharacterized protein n=1 Tax=Liparis tanakae TaxID=230148 RepID=A0A4Z2IPE2_9TELE|nr:hypothetical protein EYF80_009927 [Liparis tanakae]
MATTPGADAEADSIAMTTTVCEREGKSKTGGGGRHGVSGERVVFLRVSVATAPPGPPWSRPDDTRTAARSPDGYGALKAPCAAEDAAPAAAVWKLLLVKTPWENSCWAFWKLAPVRRYMLWTWREAKGASYWPLVDVASQ